MNNIIYRLYHQMMRQSVMAIYYMYDTSLSKLLLLHCIIVTLVSASPYM